MKTESAAQKSNKIQKVCFDKTTTKLFIELATTKDAFDHAANTGFSVLQSPDTPIENNATGGGFVWKVDDVIIGFSQYCINLRESIAMISLFIMPEFRNSGSGTECIEQLVDYLFENTKIFSIHGSLLPWNQRSLRMMLKNGFKEVGYSKNMFWMPIEHSPGAQLPWTMPSVQIELTRGQWRELKSKTMSAERSFGINEPAVATLELNRLKSQLHLGTEQDFSFLRSHIGKMSIHKVVDIGCGPGHYLRSLSDEFPELECTGIDINEMFIEYAREVHTSEKINFKSANLLSDDIPWPKADLYIVRFIFQHFSERDRLHLLKRFKDEAPENSALYIVDIDDRTWITEPVCHSFHLAMKIRDDVQSASGGDRMVGFKIPTFVNKAGLKLASFNLNAFSTMTIPSKELFEIVESFSFRQSADLKVVDDRTLARFKDDFCDWYHNKMSYFGGSLCAALVVK